MRTLPVSPVSPLKALNRVRKESWNDRETPSFTLKKAVRHATTHSKGKSSETLRALSSLSRALHVRRPEMVYLVAPPGNFWRA